MSGRRRISEEVKWLYKGEEEIQGKVRGRDRDRRKKRIKGDEYWRGREGRR